MYRLVIFAILLIGSAHAQDRPTTGLMYNSAEWSNLQYDCTMQVGSTLNCSFTQTSVRKQSSGKSLQDEVKKAVEAARSEKMKPEDCDQVDKITNAVKNPDPKGPGYNEVRTMPPKARDDLLKMTGSLSEYCKTPNDQTAAKMAAITFDRESRTCSVSANNFSLSFKRVDGSQTWTSNVGPTGQCGVVTIARMEQDPKHPLFYNYVQKKVITNPSAKAVGTLSCSELDQAEQKYQWQSREIFGQCDYIKFGYF
jgi:hypothetical protein